MAIATEREAETAAGRAGAERFEYGNTAPERLTDLLSATSMDSGAWREALVRTCVGDGKAGNELDWRGFWMHEIAAACAAARIVEATGAADSRIAFAAGLLHDVGKLTLARRFPRSYARALEIAAERTESILGTELALFGVDHTQAGRRVAEQWCLPRSIVDAIWLHHQPAESLPERGTRELVLAVSIADGIARERWPGWGGAERDYRPAADAIGIRKTTIGEIAASLADDVGRLERCLGNGAGGERKFEVAGAALEALVGLARSMKPGGPIAELCAAAAEAVVAGVDVPGACVIAAADGSDILEIGARSGEGRVWDRLPLISDGSPLAEIAMLHVCGARVLPVPPQSGAILERFCGPANGIPGWAIGLVDGGRTVGALLVRAGAARVRELTSGRSPFASLHEVIAALLGQAIAAAANATRGEDLALGARRLGAAGDAATAERSAIAMAEFASGAAHELNTPLAVIAGRADQLLSWELDPELERAVSAIRENARRCGEIVNELAAFADPPAPRPAAIEVTALLASIRDAGIASGGFGAAECCVEISDDLPAVMADEEQLRTILHELLTNAIEATAGRARRLTIKAVRDRTDEQVVISVADNGRGMAPDVRERAFDPFFSRRAAGRGRGLGLSRVRRLAALNGGQVRLRSEADRGTLVEVMLPIGGDRV